jgi:hypothetical protein
MEFAILRKPRAGEGNYRLGQIFKQSASSDVKLSCMAGVRPPVAVAVNSCRAYRGNLRSRLRRKSSFQTEIVTSQHASRNIVQMNQSFSGCVWKSAKGSPGRILPYNTQRCTTGLGRKGKRECCATHSLFTN